MRKVSKSRAEDDVVSSTNGSGSPSHLANEEEHQKDSDQGDETFEESNEKDDATDFSDAEEKSKTPRKKSKAKSKSKKNKSDKSNNKKKTEEEYEVDKIIDSKKIKGKVHYLIRWKGYSADSDTWEPVDTLSCPELIQKFKDEKENSKSPVSTPKSAKKRKGSKKESKSPSKRPKSEWDAKNTDENAEYEVERILEVHHKKNGDREFLIHWKGWASKFDSWEPEDNLNCPDLIKKFMDKVDSARSKGSKSLRVAPETTNRFTLQDPSSGRRLSKRRGQRQRVRYDNAE